MPKLKSEENELKKETEKKSMEDKVLNEKGKAKTAKNVAEKSVENSKKVISKSVSKRKTESSKDASKEKTEAKSVTKKATTKKSQTLKRVKKEKDLKELKSVVNKKITKKAKPLTKKQLKEFLPEYYDLPYRYDETVVKILAQTPKRLFVYWDVSEKDKQKYLNAFGEDFFYKTYPVLLVHNEELNYTFEIPINDFANSWYLDINDSKTKYVVQLGRKFRNVQEIRTTTPNAISEQHIDLKNDYIFITDSNKLEAPNDHILFEKMRNYVTYRNVKTGYEYNKELSDILDKLRKSYKDADIKDIYRQLYGTELPEDEFIFGNPNSGSMPTSMFR